MVLTLARDSPLVSGVIAAAANFTRRNPATGLLFLNGSVDGGPKPVYATKWLKLGLEALGLHKESRRYGVPEVGDDTYSLLFWEGLTASKPVPTGPAVRCDPYPYLTWAADHFLGTTTAKLNGVLYPLTSEHQASQADYAGMDVVDPVYAAAQTSVLHGWHAAEAFLYLRTFGGAANAAHVLKSDDTKARKQHMPHLILTVVDDLGHADVGYMDSEIATPTIDALAHGGVKLKQYYVMRACSPTRSAIMTGCALRQLLYLAACVDECVVDRAQAVRDTVRLPERRAQALQALRRAAERDSDPAAAQATWLRNTRHREPSLTALGLIDTSRRMRSCAGKVASRLLALGAHACVPRLRLVPRLSRRRRGLLFTHGMGGLRYEGAAEPNVRRELLSRPLGPARDLQHPHLRRCSR